VGWAALGIGVGGALAAAAFLFSFFMAMRVEMRSSRVEVPNLTGLTLDGARQLAEPLALVLEIVDQRNDPHVASGRVLEQMPPARASVRRGRKIKLILSLGDRVLTVPDLVGQAARAVAIELRQAGFTPGDEARAHSTVAPAGRVLAQVPQAAATVGPNGRVHRLVSEGSLPAVWVMPDLVGRSRREVESWISAADLRRGAVRSLAAPGRTPGTVLSQLPPAGYPIRNRDIVELAVAE